MKINAGSRLVEAAPMAEHHFNIRTEEDGRGGVFKKTVDAKSKDDAFVAVVKGLKSAGLLYIVKSIEYIG